MYNLVSFLQFIEKLKLNNLVIQYLLKSESSVVIHLLETKLKRHVVAIHKSCHRPDNSYGDYNFQ